MNKRFFLLTAILISSAVIFTGCFESKARLDNIETPTYMTVQNYSNKNIGKIKELTSQLEGLKKKGASQDEQYKVMQEINSLAFEKTLSVQDAKFINKVMNEVVKLEGTKQGLSPIAYDKLIFIINFPQKTTGNTTYMSNVYIFSNNTALITSFDKNSKDISIKTRISKDIIKYISDYYNSKV